MNHISIASYRLPNSVAALLLTFAAAGLVPLRAQTYSDLTVTDGLRVEGSGSSYLYLRSNGVLIGPSNNAVTLAPGDLPVSGSSKSGLLWHPGKMALLVGSFPTSESSIGSNSIALNGTASGSNSFAAVGGYASGSNAFAAISSSASGNSSFATVNSTASGSYSFSEGFYTMATGSYSVAMGVVAAATGSDSTAIGSGTMASGANSTALGSGTHAGAYACCAVGACNLGNFATGGDTQWISTDPIFEVGNGTYSARSNALTVYKNGNLAVSGNAAIQGVLTVAPSSDIPMYTGN